MLSAAWVKVAERAIASITKATQLVAELEKIIKISSDRIF